MVVDPRSTKDYYVVSVADLDSFPEIIDNRNCLNSRKEDLRFSNDRTKVIVKFREGTVATKLVDLGAEKLSNEQTHELLRTEDWLAPWPPEG